MTETATVYPSTGQNKSQDNSSTTETGCSKGDKQKASARWRILRNAISANSRRSSKLDGSIHQFPGFDLLQRKRLPRKMVQEFKEQQLKVFCNNNDQNMSEDEIVRHLELALLALTALRPDNWVWDFEVPSNHSIVDGNRHLEQILAKVQDFLQEDPSKVKIKVEESGWNESIPSTVLLEEHEQNAPPQKKLRIVLAPFRPLYAIFHYTMPGEGKKLVTRERLDASPLSLQELTTHHKYNVDNTGNVRVWDCEQTLAYSIAKLLDQHGQNNWIRNWGKETKETKFDQADDISQKSTRNNDNDIIVDILELGAGMAGLTGLALAEAFPLKSNRNHNNTHANNNNKPQVRVFLTDGHPQTVRNNLIHVLLMNLNNVSCFHFPWDTNPPTNQDGRQRPPRCHIALVSDCTHFQDFHAHLFLTIAYSIVVNGTAFMCQPHRGNSLKRFLKLVDVTSESEHGPLFSVTWIETPWITKPQPQSATPSKTETSGELPNSTITTTLEDENAASSYDSNIHFPHLLVLQKLREVQSSDREATLFHIETRI